MGDWLRPRAIELTHTAWLTGGFARSTGYEETPFRWIPERRFNLQCEVDSAVFHLYGLSRDDVDEALLGHYRTKALILDVYRKMADAIATGH